VKANAIITYQHGSFDANQKQVKGRHVASGSFLEGFARYAEVDRILGAVSDRSGVGSFTAQVEAAMARRVAAGRPEVAAVTGNWQAAYRDAGMVFTPDPSLAGFAEARRYTGQRAYSICGLTHTVSSDGAMDRLLDYLIAPVQTWDALICSSTSVKAVVLSMIEVWADYLEQRIGARPEPLIQIPIIPLGVDGGKFAGFAEDRAAGADLRARLGIPKDAVVALFFGRLAMHAKAHPQPMMEAVLRANADLAARGVAADRRLHLVLTGQFPNQHIEDHTRQMITDLEADGIVHVVDGAEADLSAASWAAADIFLSLSDNLQESFGITPVEGMAAGLPCVVSDWNGYKDTVVDGETGFRVPTLMPGPGHGVPLITGYDRGVVSYDKYIGYASQVTAPSVERTAEALVTLATDPELRARMGAAGRRRVAALFDWARVIPQYQDLWQELNERRSRDGEIAALDPLAPNPRRADPLLTFKAHPTALIDRQTRFRLPHRLRADPELRQVTFDRAARNSANTFAKEYTLDEPQLSRLFSTIVSLDADTTQGGAGDSGVTVDAAVQASGVKASPNRVQRGIAWLAKYGLIEIELVRREE